jgi:drug/metabolite transporter (DMT)-like permease
VDRITTVLDRLIGSQTRGLGLRVALALLAIYVIWGSTFLAIRIGVETIPPFLLAAGRWLLAGSCLYAFARARGAERPRARQWGTAALLGALLVFFSNGGVTWAETRVPSGLAALFIASVSFWMVLLDWLRPGGTRPAARVAAGVVLGFCGVALLAGPKGGGLDVDPLGLAVLLLSALSWSIGSLAAPRLARPAAPLLAAAMQMLAGGVYLVLASLATGEPARFSPRAVSAASLVSLVYLAVFGSLVGFTLYLWLVRVAAPALVSTYACVNPVVAVFLGWALLGETITPRVVMATAVIAGAVAIVVSSRAKPSQNAAAVPRRAAESSTACAAEGAAARARA